MSATQQRSAALQVMRFLATGSLSFKLWAWFSKSTSVGGDKVQRKHMALHLPEQEQSLLPSTVPLLTGFVLKNSRCAVTLCLSAEKNKYFLCLRQGSHALMAALHVGTSACLTFTMIATVASKWHLLTSREAALNFEVGGGRPKPTPSYRFPEPNGRSELIWLMASLQSGLGASKRFCQDSEHALIAVLYTTMSGCTTLLLKTSCTNSIA